MSIEDFLADMGKNHYPAMLVIEYLYHISNYWDDLIDKDHEDKMTAAHTNRIFHMMLVELPNNPFYATHRTLLAPLMQSVCLSYEVSQVYEKDKDEHGLELGHALRYRTADIMAYVIFLCYGHDTTMKILPEYYKHLMLDRLNVYKKEKLHAC